MGNTKKYYEEMSVLRGVAILLVLLGHSIIYVPINLMEVPWCKTLNTYIYYFHMPLFFMVSGFFYYHKSSYAKYVKNKVARIMIPYLVFSILDLIPRHLFPQAINGNDSLAIDIYNIIFKGGHYWFLYILFLVFLIYPVFDKIHSKYVSGMVLAILVMLRYIKITDIFLINTIIMYLFYFMLGNVIRGLYTDKFKGVMAKTYITVSLFALFVMVGLISDNPITGIIKALIGGIMTYSFVLLIKSIKLNNILKNFGDYSLQLYLLNGFMLVPARIITVKVLHITDPLLVISIVFLSNALIGILLSKYIIDKVNIFRVLCGVKVIKSSTSISA